MTPIEFTDCSNAVARVVAGIPRGYTAKIHEVAGLDYRRDLLFSNAKDTARLIEREPNHRFFLDCNLFTVEEIEREAMGARVAGSPYWVAFAIRPQREGLPWEAFSSAASWVWDALHEEWIDLKAFKMWDSSGEAVYLIGHSRRFLDIERAVFSIAKERISRIAAEGIRRSQTMGTLFSVAPSPAFPVPRSTAAFDFKREVPCVAA